MAYLNSTDEKILTALLSSGYKQSNLELFSIRKISQKAELAYADTYNAIKKLEKKDLIKVKEIANNKAVMFNYEETIVGSYIENLKTKKFLKKFSKINHFLNLFKEQIEFISFTIILFGSYAKGKQKKNSDLDLIILCEDNFLEELEQAFNKAKEYSTLKFDVNIFSYKEFTSMLKENKKINIATEAYKNHFILTGYENYFKCINKAQK